MILQEELISVGGKAEFFYSYFMLGDTLYSVNGRFPIQPYYNLGKPGFHDDRVFLKRYRHSGSSFEVDETIDLGPGGDPRAVSDGVNAYAVIITIDLSANDCMRASLYDVRNQRLIPIKSSEPGFRYGKNWQPYLHEGKLYFVHQLTPFRAYRINISNGSTELVREADIDFKLPQFHSVLHYVDGSESFPMFRGGSNAVVSKGWIHGVGRATSQRYRHHPFFWSARDGNDLAITFTDFFCSFHKCGFNIVDPTSLFWHGDEIYLGLCCTERDWAHNQVLMHMLLVIRKDGAPINRPLTNYISRRAICESGGIPNLSRYMFFCIEMPSAVRSEHEIGGRVSLGERGHLVYGPHLPIVSSGHFCAELSYLTKAKQAKEVLVGNFEVVVSRIDAQGHQGDFKTLGMVDLVSTNWSMGEARIEFDTNNHYGCLLEFRVFVEEGVLLNAYHIRTWEIASSPSYLHSPFEYLLDPC